MGYRLQTKIQGEEVIKYKKRIQNNRRVDEVKKYRKEKLKRYRKRQRKEELKR